MDPDVTPVHAPRRRVPVAKLELDSLMSTTASAVIKVMKRNFARHGIPDECISDNGPQFDSYEYSRFARDYGFNLVKSSPYYSRGNGKAESAVKIAKNILKKSRHEDPYLALLAYRNTPQQGHAYSPVQRLSRRLRDLIPMATSQLQPQTASPRLVVQDIVGRRHRSKMQYDKKASTLQREFSPGEKVFVKPNPKNKHKPWIYSEVVRNPAPRACLVSTPLGPIRGKPTQACLPLSSGNSIFTWGRQRANGTKPTVNPTDRRAKPTGRPTKAGGAGSRTYTTECQATEIDKT